MFSMSVVVVRVESNDDDDDGVEQFDDGDSTGGGVGDGDGAGGGFGVGGGRGAIVEPTSAILEAARAAVVAKAATCTVCPFTAATCDKDAVPYNDMMLRATVGEDGEKWHVGYELTLETPDDEPVMQVRCVMPFVHVLFCSVLF